MGHMGGYTLAAKHRHLQTKRVYCKINQYKYVLGKLDNCYIISRVDECDKGGGGGESKTKLLKKSACPWLSLIGDLKSCTLDL